MNKLYVPRVELEIGEDLYLVVSNIDYIPGDPGKYSGLPEDCYEATGPEVYWKNEDAKLMYGELRSVFSFEKMRSVREIHDHYYNCPKGLDEQYLDKIIDECEILLEDK